jgi:RsiW-degrading membrane proteinase PrsW (M82 family)
VDVAPAVTVSPDAAQHVEAAGTRVRDPGEASGGPGGGSVLRAIRPLVLLGGLGVAAGGLLVGAVGIGLPVLLRTGQALTILVASGSILGLSLLLGSAAAWQAWESMQSRPSSPFRPRRVWIGVALFAVAVVVGRWVLNHPPLDLLALPVAHLTATALPPLTIVGLVAHSLPGATRKRQMVLQLASGAFLSTLVAMVLEALLIAGLIFGVLILVAAQPGGQELLQELARRLADPAILQDPAQIAAAAHSPWVWVALLAVVSGAVPLIEESFKTVGVGLMLYRRPGREEAFLWGLASGAGFAMVESALNSVLGLAGWASAVLMRVPASLMHCFTGALMGLAWQAVFVERQRRRGLALFAGSLTLHGVWNAAAIAVGLLSLDQQAPLAAPSGAARLAASASLILLLVMASGVAMGLVAMTRRLRARSSLGLHAEVSGREPEGSLAPETDPMGAQMVADEGTASADQAPEQGRENEVP